MFKITLLLNCGASSSSTPIDKNITCYRFDKIEPKALNLIYLNFECLKVKLNVL